MDEELLRAQQVLCPTNHGVFNKKKFHYLFSLAKLFEGKRRATTKILEAGPQEIRKACRKDMFLYSVTVKIYPTNIFSYEVGYLYPIAPIICKYTRNMTGNKQELCKLKAILEHSWKLHFIVLLAKITLAALNMQ